jgi:hypothetical protein
MKNLTVQKVFIFLVILTFFVSAPWLTAEFLGGNYAPVAMLAAVGILLIFLFLIKDRCWLAIPFCLGIEGNFNFLPLNFSTFELSVFAVLAYMILQIIMGRPIGWSLGPAFLWVPLVFLLTLLMFHWIRSGDIGIRALGGTGWGGRYYFKILMASLTMPILASFPNRTYADFQWVPLLYFLGSFVDLVPQTITTLAPPLAPIIFRFYSGVNVAEYGMQLLGTFSSYEGITRIGQFGRLGTGLALLILCYFPFHSWLAPGRFWVTPVLVLSFLATAFAGFRSYIFNFGIILLVGLFGTARFWALILIPMGALAVVGIAFSQGRIVEYPRSLQRAMSFLPGDWNEVAKADAKGSSEWRQKMRELFFKEYFTQAPWVGQGYHFDPKFALEEVDIYLRVAALRTGDPFQDVRGFLERRNPHEGDLHILLAAGVVGMGLLVWFFLALVFYALKVLIQSPPNKITPIQIWAAALMVQQCISFFVVYGDLGITLVQICPIASILAASEKLRAQEARFGNSSGAKTSESPN